MKAILINSVEQTVTEVEFNGTLSGSYELINCTCIERVSFDGKDHYVYIDEEGGLPHRYKGVRFMLNNYHSPIHGNGLVLGTVYGQDGQDWGECKLTLEEVKSNVAFFIKDVNPHAY